MLMPIRFGFVATAFATLVASGVGCSSGNKTYPVSGKVLVNGQPAVGAIVVFNPAEKPDTMERKPTAVVKDDGSFIVGTLEADDGAAPGDYLVTVVWPGKAKAAGPAKPLSGDERAPEASDQLKGKYSDAKGSGVKVTVKPERNELPPFELKK